MGANQSSQTSEGSFSIDPNGNVRRRQNLLDDETGENGKGGGNSDEHSMPASETTLVENQPQQGKPEESVPFEPPPPLNLFTIETMPSSNKANRIDEINLEEADIITNKLKDRYKPNSAELAGKQKSVFEEVERNLIQCYKANKMSPSNCTGTINEYRNFVREKRNEILKKSTHQQHSSNQFANKIPLITSILVIITCVLMHLASPVQCYGAMSIDLGSEWMKVGLVAPNVQMDIVLNAQSQRKTAMAIAFLNNERFVGDSALDIASKYPEKTFTHFLDLVGKSIDDESVSHYKKRFPHASIQSHQPNSTSILLNHPDGLSFTPLELIATMFQHAHEQVTNRLANRNEIASDVVITVPPFFNELEKKVIIDAAKIVGLNVLRLTNVNSAFALSYGIFRHKDYLPELIEPVTVSDALKNRTRILFFDQGASHTSVSVADYHSVEHIIEDSSAKTGIVRQEFLPTITIKAQVYDRFLGGFDMQLKLRDYLIEEFSQLNKIPAEKIYKRGKSVAKLLKESGRVKRVLSANTDHLVRVENVIDDKDMKQPISREKYEQLNEELLSARIIKLLDKLYDEHPNIMKRGDPLTSVIIVGGNTRTPKIQQVLMDYFKLDNLGKSINADEGAALAALYQAASLGRGFRVKKFVLEEYGEVRKVFDPSMTTTVAPITTGESIVASILDTLNATFMNHSEPDNSTKANTTASSSATLEPEVDEVDPNSIYSKSELKRMKNNLDYLRDQDYMRLQRLSLKNSLESLLSEAREKLSDDENTSEQFKDNKDKIQQVIHETYNWLEDGPQMELDNVTILAEKYTSIHDMLTTTTTTTTNTTTTTTTVAPEQATTMGYTQEGEESLTVEQPTVKADEKEEVTTAATPSSAKVEL